MLSFNKHSLTENTVKIVMKQKSLFGILIHSTFADITSVCFTLLESFGLLT